MKIGKRDSSQITGIPIERKKESYIFPQITDEGMKTKTVIYIKKKSLNGSI